MTDRELMQMALDALTQANQCIFISAKLPFPPALNATSKAAEALRARLAQPEQEPVAWRFYEGDVWCYVDHLTDLPQNKFEPLYTAPPQREWQGLTDEEANELTYASIAEIDAKLKEKNYG